MVQGYDQDSHGCPEVPELFEIILFPIRAWERVGILQEELEIVAEERDVWNILINLLPP